LAPDVDSVDNGVHPGTSFTMDLQEFTATTTLDAPPKGLTPALEALWHLRKGDWNRAHEIVQAHEDMKDYAAVHAHLHRIEGDLANAGYWYRRAGKNMSDIELEQEWKALAAHFLEEN
jgi:hypothetical protein